jgi:hypothetical protein
MESCEGLALPRNPSLGIVKITAESRACLARQVWSLESVIVLAKHGYFGISINTISEF